MEGRSGSVFCVNVAKLCDVNADDDDMVPTRRSRFFEALIGTKADEQPQKTAKDYGGMPAKRHQERNEAAMSGLVDDRRVPPDDLNPSCCAWIAVARGLDFIHRFSNKRAGRSTITDHR